MDRNPSTIYIVSVIVAVFFMNSCTILMTNEDDFRKAAAKRAGIIQKPLEQVYRCFVSKGGNYGYQQLYPESGEAVWSYTKGNSFGAIAEFRRLGPTSTEVTVLGLEQGDMALYPGEIWSRRVSPCM